MNFTRIQTSGLADRVVVGEVDVREDDAPVVSTLVDGRRASAMVWLTRSVPPLALESLEADRRPLSEVRAVRYLQTIMWR